MPNSHKEFWTEFLELYKNLPALWKIKSEEYGNRTLKARCYEKMVKKLREIDPSANRNTVVRKINSFRSNYRREMRKVKQSNLTRTGTPYIPNLWYFPVLSFLGGELDEITIENDSYSLQFESELDQKVNIAKVNSPKVTDESTVPFDGPRENFAHSGVLAQVWASQYDELSSGQKIFARKLISDILFQGCIRNLNIKVVREVEKVLDCSSLS